MPIANGITLPNPLSNGTTADAVPVMANYNTLLNALNRALLDGGGTAGMNAQSTVIHNLSPGVAGTDAINLNQLNNGLGLYLPLTGGALAGPGNLTVAGTLGVSGASTFAAISGTTLNMSGTSTIGGNESVTGTGTFGNQVTINSSVLGNPGLTINGTSTVGNGTTGLLTLSDPNNNQGASIKFIGNGSSNQIKYLRVLSGALQVVNSGNTAVIVSIDDAGNLSASGAGSFGLPSAIAAPTLGTSALTLNGSGTAGAGGAQLFVNDPNNSNGATVKFTGNGATTPSKWIGAAGGSFIIKNNAFTNILILDDAGNLTLLAGATTTGFTATGADALTMGPNAGVRDRTNGASTVYFDVSIGGASGGGFAWRTTSSLTQLMTLNSAGSLTTLGAVTAGSAGMSSPGLIESTGTGSGGLYGLSNSRTSPAGQVGVHLYNGGGVAEWLIYQPIHATDDKLHFAKLVAGVASDYLTVDTAGAATFASSGTFNAPGTGAVNALHVLGSGTASSSSALVKIEDTNSTAGANILLIGNGTTNPAKSIRVISGALQFINSAYSSVIFNLDDAGNLTLTGSLALGGAQKPVVQSVASAATVTPTFDNDAVDITAQAVALTLANPAAGTVNTTASNLSGMVIRIKDNGTARAITYGTQYVGIGFALPSTTVAGKVLVLGMVYNSGLTRWEVVSQVEE